MLLLRAPQQRNDCARLPACWILRNLLPRPRFVFGRKGEMGGLIGMKTADGHWRLLKTRTCDAGFYRGREPRG
jgi:hypothetical protein